MLCAACGFPILDSEIAVLVPWAFTPAGDEMADVHEHCVDAETAMAADLYDPAEDYPHGDL